MRKKWVIAALVVSVTAGRSPATEVVAGGLPCWPREFAPLKLDAGGIETAGAELGSTDAAVRQAAMEKFEMMGPPALGALQKLTGGGDAEIRAQAAQLIASGLVPPMLPARLAAMKGGYLTGRTGMRFLAPGNEQAKPGAIYESPSAPYADDLDVTTEVGRFFMQFVNRENAGEAAEMARRMNLDITGQANRLRLECREAIASGELDKAEGMLREAIEKNKFVREDFAALVVLRRGAGFDPGKEYAALRIDPINKEYNNDMARLLYRAAGDYQKVATIGSLNVGDGITGYSYALQEAGQQAKLDELKKEWASRSLQKVAPQAYDYIMDDKIEETEERLKVNGNGALTLILGVQLRMNEAYANRPIVADASGWRQIAMQMTGLGLTWDGGPATNHADMTRRLLNKDAYGKMILNLSVGKPEWDEWDRSHVASNFWYWWSFYPAQPEEPARYQRAMLALGWKVNADQAHTLADAAISGTAAPYLKQQRANMEAAFDTLWRLGYEDEAARIATAWSVRENDGWGFVMLGDLAMAHGRASEAFLLYETAASLNRTDPGLLYRAAYALGKIRGMKAPSDEMMTYVPLLTMASGVEKVALAKARLEGIEAALAWKDDYHRKIGSPLADGRARYSRDVERAEAQKDWTRALTLQGVVVHTPGIPLEQMQEQWHYQQLRALDGMARKDYVTATAALEREMHYGPPDVDLIEKLIPALRDKEAEGAKKVLNLARERFAEVVERYPGQGDFAARLKRVEALLK